MSLFLSICLSLSRSLSRSLFPSICLCLCLCLCFCLSVFISLCMSLFLSICLFQCPCIRLCLYLSTSLSMSLSKTLFVSICLFLCLCFYLSIAISLSLSLFPFMFLYLSLCLYEAVIRLGSTVTTDSSLEQQQQQPGCCRQRWSTVRIRELNSTTRLNPIAVSQPQTGDHSKQSAISCLMAFHHITSQFTFVAFGAPVSASARYKSDFHLNIFIYRLSGNQSKTVLCSRIAKSFANCVLLFTCRNKLLTCVN